MPAKDYFIDQPPSGEQITQALGYGVDNYLQTQFADLVGTQQEDNAYRQGLGRIINAFGAGR